MHINLYLQQKKNMWYLTHGLIQEITIQGQIIIFQPISSKLCGAPSLIFLIFTYHYLHYINRLNLQFKSSKCSGLEIIAL